MAGYRYKINEYVMCKGDVCKVADIKKMSFAGVGEKMYYIIEPIYEERSRTYVPVDLKDIKTAVRGVLSVDEINAIIRELKDSEPVWIDDVKERVSGFDKILQDGDRADILRMLGSLKARKTEVESEGKKLYAGDSRVLKTAEKIITEEFAFVLGLKKNEVESYIDSQI